MDIESCTIFRGTDTVPPLVGIKLSEELEFPSGVDRAKSQLQTDTGQKVSLDRWAGKPPTGRKRTCALEAANPGKLYGETADVTLVVRSSGKDQPISCTAPICDAIPPGPAAVAAQERIAKAHEGLAKGAGEAAEYAKDEWEKVRDGAGERVSKEWDAFTAYPVQVSTASPRVPPAGLPGRTAVRDELRIVLGRSNLGDNKAVLAALDRSITFDEAAERWEWRPRSYAGQNDIGAGVTGAQASVASYVATLKDEIENPIRQLSALCCVDCNETQIEIRRSALLSSLEAFSGELGTDGGPRVARAAILIEQCQAQLASFGHALGMVPAGGRQNGRIEITRKNVLVRDDEDRLTSFIIARDRIAAVATAFDDYRQDGAGDFGFDLVGLQRDLDVLPDLAASVGDAMDSFGFGPEQREIVSIEDNGMPLSVEGLLKWVADFPDQEARPLLQDSGFLGVELIAARAETVRNALDSLVDAIEEDNGPLPATAPRSRVRAPLVALRAAVARVKEDAEEIVADHQDASPAVPAV
jgi:hypothetical protein